MLKVPGNIIGKDGEEAIVDGESTMRGIPENLNLPGISWHTEALYSNKRINLMDLLKILRKQQC